MQQSEATEIKKKEHAWSNAVYSQIYYSMTVLWLVFKSHDSMTCIFISINPHI